MAAPATTQSGPILELNGFRFGAIWMIAASVGVACLPGLAVDELPRPDASVTTGLLVIVLAALAAEVAAVARPGHTFTDVLLPADAVVVFGLAFASPLALIAGRLIAVLVSDGIHRRHPAKIAFNAALCGAETLAAVAAYRLILQGGSVTSLLGVLAAAVAAATSLAVGVGLMTAVHALHGERTPAAAVRTLGSFALAGLAIGLAAVFSVSALAG